MLAVRTNERAAASLGVNVFTTKLHAFVVSAGIAGLAGVLLAFTGYAITYESTFDPFSSITAVTLAVLGGVGDVAGPILGSTLAAGGIGTLVTDLFEGIDAAWLVLVGGIAFLLILLQDPNGMVSANLHTMARLRGRRASRTGAPGAEPLTAELLGDPEPAQRPTTTLEVNAVSYTHLTLPTKA